MPPGPALVVAGRPRRKKVLSWGHSISAQNQPGFTNTTTTTAAVYKNATAIPLAAIGSFVVGDYFAVRLSNGRIWVSSVASIAGNTITAADKVPVYITTGFGVYRIGQATLTAPVLVTSYGTARAVNALLGGPCELVSSYGYSGATQLQMYADLDRELRYYQPDYVYLHLFENDVADGAYAGSVTLASLLERTRNLCRMCLSAGATPIVASSMPYYKPGIAGVTGTRVADFDAILAHLTAPVAGGKTQLQIDVPGAYGFDVSTLFLNTSNATYPRAPLAGWTDGVHPNTNKRFFIGEFVKNQIGGLFPKPDPLVNYALSNAALTTLQGSGGTATNLIAGSVVPAGYTITAAGQATCQTTRNADGSLKFIGAWPGQAFNSSDYIKAQYYFGAVPPLYNLGAHPPTWNGTNRTFYLGLLVRVNSHVGLASIAPVATLRPSYNSFSGATSLDMMDSVPIGDGRTMLFTTPHFQFPDNIVSLEITLEIRTKSAVSPANYACDIDVSLLGLFEVQPEIPFDYA